MTRALINLPATAKPGEVIEIKVLIQHPMETGFRPGANGEILPRDIVTRFVCTYDDVEVFSAELHPAVAANPFMSFTILATASGTLRFTWSGDNGFTLAETRGITVG